MNTFIRKNKNQPLLVIKNIKFYNENKQACCKAIQEKYAKQARLFCALVV